jgi:4-amino-4-deoxy-L-arabinose transferase-like glycosyltransferase
MFALSAILGMALAVRMLAWSRAEMMMNDGPHFLWQAQAFFGGDWQAAIGHHYAPGFGGATALVLHVVDDPALAAISVAMTSGLILVVAAWGLAREAFPETPGAAPGAALVAAFNVRCVAYTSDIQADGMFAALFLCSAWALLAATRRDGSLKHAALGGLIMGLAYLVRLEALFLCLPLGLWCLGGFTAPTSWRRRLGVSAVAMATALIGVAPYVIGLHEVTGHWGLSNKPSAQQAGLASGDPTQPGAEVSPLNWPRVSRRAAPAGANTNDAPGGGTSTPPKAPDRGSFMPSGWAAFFALAQPPPATADDDPAAPGFGWVGAAHHSMKKFLSAIRLEYLLLIVPGLLTLRRRRRQLCAVLLLTIAAWLAITTLQLRLSGFLSTRHMMVPIALLLPVAGAGMASLWSKGLAWRVLVALTVIETLEVAQRDYHSNHRPRLESLAWIEQHSEPEQLFGTHRQRDGWYARRVPMIVELPVFTEHMAANMRVYDVPWLAFDLDKLQALQPEWLEQELLIEQVRFGEGDETVVIYAPDFDREH